MAKINIYIKNLDQNFSVETNQIKTLEDMSKKIFKDDYKRYLGARESNKILHLNKKLKDGMSLEYLDIESLDGYRIYTRTISAIFIKACKEIYPNRTVRIEQFLGPGLYISFEENHSINFKDIPVIGEKMKEIISKDLKLDRKSYNRLEAIEILKEHGHRYKTKLFETLNKEKIDIYTIGNYKDTFHGYLAPSTSYVEKFELKYYYPGVILLFPNRKNPNSIPYFKEKTKLARVFDESKRWAEILDLKYLGSLNKKIKEGKVGEIIRVSEALQEKKIARIADDISEKDDVSMVLISGPSSSGKTTFANRLATHLKVNGKRPIAISLDDYFVNRVDTPLDKDGNYDFEAVEAIDINKLNNDLISLLEGEEIELPKFNFLTGIRENSGRFVKVDRDHPIILEGIHGLNPKLTKEIPDKNKFKIYISALTQLNIDAHNRITTTDTRFIRRLVRDYKFRGNDPIRTFDLWKNVRIGEEEHIFPYQEEADIMFDSALVYELSILKKYAIPLLKEITSESVYYSETKRLIRFLDYFIDIKNEEAIPPNSILREFIGGADFNVH